MANRFWVGGTNTWNATAGTKWSTTSGGGGGSAVPTASDDVFLDGNSGAVTVTLGATGNCRSITFTGFTGTFAGSSALNVGTSTSGNFTLVSGMTYSYTGTITFVSTTTGNQITTAGKTIASFIFQGASGAWTLQDNVTFNNSGSFFNLILDKGTLNTNNKSLNVTTFELGTGNTQTLNLGSSVISLDTTNVAADIEFGTPTGLTFNAGTSEITTFGADSSTTIQDDSASLTIAFNKITVPTGQSLYLNGLGPISVLTLNPNSTFFLTDDQTQVVTTLSAIGTSGNLITIEDDGTGSGTTTISIASGIVSCDYLSLTNCHATGGATFYAGANSVNNGNNTGWIFTAPPSGNVGSSTGSASVSATGASNAASVGSSTGVSTATATGRSIFTSVGSAIGSATVAGTGLAAGIGSGTSIGSSTVQAIGSSTAAGVGSSTGIATVSGIGIGAFIAVGSSTGSASVLGVGTAAALSVGTALGTASALAISNALKSAVGNAAGTSTVIAHALLPFEALSVLSFMTNAPVNVAAEMSDDDITLSGLMNNSLSFLGFLTNANINSTGLMSNSPVTLLENF